MPFFWGGQSFCPFSLKLKPEKLSMTMLPSFWRPVTIMMIRFSAYCVQGAVHFTCIIVSFTLNHTLRRKAEVLFPFKWRNTVKGQAGLQSQLVNTEILVSDPWHHACQGTRALFLQQTNKHPYRSSHRSLPTCTKYNKLQIKPHARPYRGASLYFISP